ncbi:MAG TPA: hypothetical protein VE991_01835 [Acidimicrobiales bacterium]|nr:hypothetical protein [Acidimicrobiales bacterium]
MGQGTAEAVAQVEETRARLDAEVAELQRRVPPMVEQAKRKAVTGAAMAGGLVVMVIGLRLTVRIVGKRRAAKKAASARLSAKVRAALPDTADLFARSLPERVEQLARSLPERVEQLSGRVEDLAERLAS